jgi:hypothetical protein
MAVIYPDYESFCLRHHYQSGYEYKKLEIPKSHMASAQKLVKYIIDSKMGETVSKQWEGIKHSETDTNVALMIKNVH